jgi:Bacterial SH3 domain
MWFGRFLGLGMAVLATPAVAAPGDALLVTGDVVNVRAGPGTRNPVLFHVSRDQRVVEAARSGDWVQVQVPGEPDGWIHQSLLAVTGDAQPAPQTLEPAPQTLEPAPQTLEPAPQRLEPAPVGSAHARDVGGAAPMAAEGEAIAAFRGDVSELNARAVAVAGVELFTGAEAADGGTVQVMVTEAWDLVPEAGQRSYTNALFDHWRAAAGGSEPLRLQVVDPRGAVVSEKSGPALP